MTSPIPDPRDPRLEIALTGRQVRLRVSGSWTLANRIPGSDALEEAMAASGAEGFVVGASALGAWDSGLVTFLFEAAQVAARHGGSLDPAGLPDGARRLLALALTVPARDSVHVEPDDAVSARVGYAALHAWDTLVDATEVQGETLQALGAVLRGRAWQAAATPRRRPRR